MLPNPACDCDEPNGDEVIFGMNEKYCSSKRMDAVVEDSFVSILGIVNFDEFSDSLHDKERIDVNENRIDTFSCTTCFRQFLRKSSLEKHIRTHTDKKLRCEQFPKKKNLDLNDQPLPKAQHQLKVELAKCELCLKHFLDLENHMKTHSDEEPNKYAFASKHFIPNVDLDPLEHSSGEIQRSLNIKDEPLSDGEEMRNSDFLERVAGGNQLDIDYGKDFQIKIEKEPTENYIFHKSDVKNTEPSILMDIKEVKLYYENLKLPNWDPICNDRPHPVQKFHEKSDDAIHVNAEKNCSFHKHGRNHDKASFECNFCAKKFSFKSNLTTHMKIHTGEKPFSCNLCARKFLHKLYLNIHMRTHTGEKPFTCDLCNKKFGQQSHLIVHMRIHTGEKPFTCEICAKKFNTKSILDNHIYTHTGQNMFLCKFCAKKFVNKSRYEFHMRAHTGEKSLFACKLCEKQFLYKSRLNKHMITHTGEKPFFCKYCAKKFSDQSHCIRHMKIHTGDKPFSCKFCPKKFSDKSQFNGHMKTHTGEEPFTCQLCTKKFVQKSHFDQHMRTHTGEKTYACKFCTKKFGRRSQLDTHIMITHT